MQLDAEILESIRVGRGRDVDLPTILDRVDSSQRWLLSFDELAGGLARLGGSGQIEESSSGTYRLNRTGGPRDIQLDRDTYDRAVTEYRDGFARDVVDVLGSRPMRAMAALVPKSMLDLDATRIAFLLERHVRREGAVLGDPLDRDPLILPVRGTLGGEERRRLAQVAREALIGHHLADRRVHLRFDDGSEESVGA